MVGRSIRIMSRIGTSKRIQELMGGFGQNWSFGVFLDLGFGTWCWRIKRGIYQTDAVICIFTHDYCYAGSGRTG